MSFIKCNLQIQAHTQRTLKNKNRLVWALTGFVLMGTTKLYRNLSVPSQILKQRSKVMLPDISAWFYLRNATPMSWLTLLVICSQSVTLSRRYWAACESPSCIHGSVWSFSYFHQLWCHKQTTRYTSQASSGRKQHRIFLCSLKFNNMFPCC